MVIGILIKVPSLFIIRPSGMPKRIPGDNSAMRLRMILSWPEL